MKALMTDLDYVIACPSHRRAFLIPRLLKLIPTVIVSVDEREKDDYLQTTPPDQLVTHPPTDCFVAVRRHMMEHFSTKTRAVMFTDDDLKCVRCLVGRHPRKITDPDAILRIIENSIRICRDPGIKAWGYNRNPNPMQFLGHEPMSLVGPMSAAFGYIGAPRMPDAKLRNQEDIDIVMQHLLHDRIIWQDRRFYWDYGATYGSNPGGCQDVRRMDDEKADTALLKAKWGRSINIEDRDSGTTRKMSIRVVRKSSISVF